MNIQEVLQSPKKLRKLIVTEAIEKYEPLEYIQISDEEYLIDSDIINDQKHLFLATFDSSNEIFFEYLKIPEPYNEQMVESGMPIDEIYEFMEIESTMKRISVIDQLGNFKLQNLNMGLTVTMKLFATIFQIIESHESEYFYFSANKNEQSRVSLYDMFARMINRKKNYELVDNNDLVEELDANFEYYIFMRV